MKEKRASASRVKKSPPTKNGSALALPAQNDLFATVSGLMIWSHVIEVLPLKTPEARLFYFGEAATRQLGKRELRQLIARKAFERKEIANTQLTETSTIPLDTFKDPYERQDGENAPIGLILCAEKSREQIELLQLDQDNIMVAEHWTVFPERPVFERRIHALLESAREQVARRKALLPGKNKGDAA